MDTESVVNELAMAELLAWIVRRLPGLSKEEKDRDEGKETTPLLTLVIFHVVNGLKIIFLKIQDWNW